MSSHDDILEKIEQYTSGKMSAQEKTVFEKQLSVDKDLQNQVEISRIVDEMIVGNEALKLKEQMSRDLSKTKSNFGVYLIPILFLLGVVTFYFLNINKDSNSKNELKKTATIVEKAESVFESSKIIESPKKQFKIAEKPRPVIVSIGKSVNKNSVVEENVAQKNSEFKNISRPITEKEKAVVSVNEQIEGPKIKHAQPLKNPCLNFKATLDFYTVASCKGDENGEVHLTNKRVDGGTQPFVYYLGEKSSSSDFKYIVPGQYELKVKDANNCFFTISNDVFVKEKTCKKNQEFVFNPDHDGTWAIPYDKDKNAILFTMIDKAGKVFYQAQVNHFIPESWHGESTAGLALEIGLYFFSVEYADKSIDEGSILISR